MNNTAAGNARDIAFHTIRNKILTLELKPGEALSDKQVAEELHMSRTPVREAILILSTANMVVLRPQSGTFVTPIDPAWVEIEQFSRRALEKEIVRLACGRISPALAARYDETLRAYAGELDGFTPGRILRLLELDNEFHSLAFLAAGQEALFRHHIRRDLNQLERLRALSLLFEGGAHLLDDHRRIAAALIAGDERAALSELEEHLSRYRESLQTARERFPEYFSINVSS